MQNVVNEFMEKIKKEKRLQWLKKMKNRKTVEMKN